MNEIAPITTEAPAAFTAAEPALAGSLLNFVARAMADPATNVDKLEALLRIQREIVAADARLQFNRAMSQAQAEMQPILRDATNDQTKSKYARLETIDAAIRPIYTRHGFCLTFDTMPTEGATVRVVCEVAHSAGHTRLYHLDAGLDIAGPQGKPNKTPLHGLGSTLSYLRRYLTCMIFHVVLTSEDDDGNGRRDDLRRLTNEQVAELNALMRGTRTHEAKFLAAMAPALRSITEAPASDFARLKNALLTKKSVLAQRAANQGDRS